MEPSQAYLEKFLYRRNEIQAASIDSIVRKHSLFVGVGAAHLPGSRGVIELLRKKGYTLRPVMMPDRDAVRRDDIDKIKVPVSFSTYTSDDGDFSVNVPGILHRRPDTHTVSDSWQYADMSNGAYYLVGRVNTHSCFVGEKEENILNKIDSLLYENIPGKILRKSEITRSGYKGFEVSSRTRRGDLQRYNILVTPYEIWVFKMSGTNNYAEGPEADQFFGSIRIRGNPPAGPADFSPSSGGFTVRLPGQPRQEVDRSSSDEMPRWEYEATDSTTGDSYLIWKKTVQNYRFLEEDTADLALMEESFRLSDWISRRVRRKTGVYRNRACLDAVYQGKDGAWIRARFLLHGPDEYVLAAHSRNKDRAFGDFFNSFGFTPYRYNGHRHYVDSFLHLTVVTPVVPDVDAGMRHILERATSEDFLNSLPDYNGYWPHPRTALFQDDSTGEAVFVSVETFPKYYYPKDSGSFWSDETNEKHLREDMIVSTWKALRMSPETIGYEYTVSDTNSSRRILNRVFLNGNHLFRILSLSDSSDTASTFIRRFYSSIHPISYATGSPVFESKLDTFFHDFYSTDSLTAQRARDAIPNVYFGPAGVARLLQAIATLPYNGKDYFETKTKLINELGYINDPVSIEEVVHGLHRIYEQAGDTSTIQNAVFKALAHLKTREAYGLLKQLMVQDPAIFDNVQDYNYLFEDLGDSLALARSLFPDLLRLASVEDYRNGVQNLLASLVDSGYIGVADYESYFSQIWFDARIQWKKQEGRDEKKLQKKEDETEDNSPDDGEDNTGNPLDNFAVLLAPFYDKNPNIPRFFDKMLTSRDGSLRLSTAILLLRQHRTVPDSVIRNLA
ncbi:MAG TPA: TraB/GumN family protein, partial [Puia sp.]|nr:TraB/GumN family protein [Puia sp.]